MPLPPDAVATFELCWAVLTALSVAPTGPRAPAPAAHPLARRPRAGRQRSRVRPRDRSAAEVRRRRADRAGAVRPRAHPDAGDASRRSSASSATTTIPPPTSRRRSASRRGRARGTSPGCPRSRSRCTGPTDGGAPGRGDARRATGRGGAAALGLRPGRGRSRRGGPAPALVVTRCQVAGSNSSTRLPAGSAAGSDGRRDRRPRRCGRTGPAARSRSISASKSSTIRWMRLRPGVAASAGVARAPELAGPDRRSRSGPRTTSAKGGAGLGQQPETRGASCRSRRPLGRHRRGSGRWRTGLEWTCWTSCVPLDRT